MRHLGHFSARFIWLFALVLLVILVGDHCADDAAQESKSPKITDAKKALAEFNGLIGGWRGIGQPKRNSRVGAWQETAEWVWEFKGKQPAIRYNVDMGQLLKTASVSFSPKTQQFTLSATLPDDATRDFVGKSDGDKVVLESKPDDDGFVHRISITQLNEKRTVVLFERRKATQSFYFRVASVGYTRQGTSLAVEGAGTPECIVSGGKGTIKVSHKGKVYWVCCTGCKQAFDDDPEGVIADYKKLLEEREAAKKSAKKAS
ncbi:MAG: hypothetical protein O3A00_01290 [Planctomycetota bacterium]|nr:hypothetical protein [Planctomycetota bacterium]